MTSPVSLVVPGLALVLAAAAISPARPTAAAGSAGLAARPAAAPATARNQPTTTGRTPEAAGAPAGPASAVRLRASWAWPLTPQPSVVRPFIRPESRWGAGHRGVDLDGDVGQPVHAVAAGTVSHVGVVAGRGTVSLLHASGIRSTYEPLDPSVRVGQVVARGAVLGTLTVAGSHCAPDSCLHLGALRGRSYLDPLVLLLGGRVRLLPMG